jgi:Icc protein
MKIVWITDPHLNFLTSTQIHKFARSIGGHAADAVVITGDIAEAPNLKHCLNEFASSLKGTDIYFVLGNHDLYRGSFAGSGQTLRYKAPEMDEIEARFIASMTEAAKQEVARHLAAGRMPPGEIGLAPNLIWLEDIPPIELAPSGVGLLGNMGWFDGVHGDALGSNVVMNDFESIADLRPFYHRLTWDVPGCRQDMIDRLGDIADGMACDAKGWLNEACKKYKKIVFATHFPPFKEACWHEGAVSDKNWLPWFTSAAMGKALDEVAAANPETRILVLCGHTHSPGVYRRAENLMVVTGKAVYGAPSVAGLIDEGSFEGWG